MYLSVVTPPVSYGVTLTEAKAQCRLLDADTTHDTLLTSLIAQASATIDTMTGCLTAIHVMQTTLDGFPTAEMELGVYPVTAITSLAYDDVDGDAQTLTADVDYYTGLSSMYPKLYPVTAWPGTKAGKPGTVRVQFIAGYTTLPDDLKLAILMRVSELFNNPSESTSDYDANPTINTIKAIVGPYRSRWLAK